MNLQLIIAAVLATVSFLGGWSAQSWRYGAKEKVRVEQQLYDQRVAATAAIRHQEAVIAASNAAEDRARNLRLDAAGTRTALVGLSDATAAALHAAAASQSACIERADTLGKLLNTVAAAGGELAAKADRHANDALKMSEAWPRIRGKDQ